jgi:hypothetical protein
MISPRLSAVAGILLPLAAIAQSPEPVTPERILNSTTSGAQNVVAIAPTPNGFVAVWESAGQDGDGDAIIARRFDTQGLPLSGEIVVNTTTAGDQLEPDVATDAQGNFVVVWETPANGGDIAMRLFNAAGEPLTPEMTVNQTLPGKQAKPTVGRLPSGDFAVAWEGPGTGLDVYLREFDPTGLPYGDEMVVNQTLAGDQGDPDLACNEAAMIVVWEGQDASGSGVYFRRVSSPVGNETRANVGTAGDQDDASVALDAQGRFVIAWESASGDGSGNGIVARSFNANGTPLTGDTKINTFTAGTQEDPTVTVSPDGTAVVAWESAEQDGDADGLFMQRFDFATHVFRGVETPVTTTTADDQQDPCAIILPNGRMVISWESSQQDGSADTAIARVFKLPPTSGTSTKPVVALTGKKKIVTSKAAVVLKGTATDNGAIEEVLVTDSSKTKTLAKLKVRNGVTSWKARVRLKAKRNVFTIQAKDNSGTKSKAIKAKVIRKP